MIIRPDLSEQLVHLTKGESQHESEKSFRKIISESVLLGGSGNIRGGFRVVCFTEAPIDILSRIFTNPTEHGFRYRPYGVMVSKLWLFKRGGRPVIYQPESEYSLLPEFLRYRHVRYEPQQSIDFMFEREWRILTDALVLDPSVCTLIVPNRQWEERFKQEHIEHDMRIASVSGFNPFTRITNYPWHFLALEDLGVRIAQEK
jgi:hypothetical protein